jgi:hypothetical protein
MPVSSTLFFQNIKDQWTRHSVCKKKEFEHLGIANIQDLNSLLLVRCTPDMSHLICCFVLVMIMILQTFNDI